MQSAKLANEKLKKISGRVYVFEGRNDENSHRTRQAVWKDIKRAAAAFRVKDNFTVHSLRKTYAVELMRKYGDIKKVSRALNHENDIVTAIYALADIINR
jgi:integrase